MYGALELRTRQRIPPTPENRLGSQRTFANLESTMSATRIYADYASTTPVRPEVVEAMLPYFSDGFNASSVHAEGRRARRAVDDARATIAQLLGAQPREIVFTSGGSEADNLAIFGIAHALAQRGKHLVTSAIEHHAVLHAVDQLRDEGWEVTVLDVDPRGAPDPGAFLRTLGPQTTLATMMLANNEIGTIAPIAALAQVAHERGVLFHTDAVQAPAFLSLDVDELQVDALSISAHKFYGPKGVGALYLRTGTPVRAQLVGGNQEFAKRAGTENVAGIVGMAKAMSLAAGERADVVPRLRALRDRFESAVLGRLDAVHINGRDAPRLPNISNISFAGADAEAIVLRLDLDGASISSGSACASGALEASHVIAALHSQQRWRRGAVRFSFGRATTEDEIDRLTELVIGAIGDLRGVATANLVRAT